MTEEDSFIWTGRYDGEGPEHWRIHQIVVDRSTEFASRHDEGTFHSLGLAPRCAPKNDHYALIGFACDEGVRRNQGRVGAVGGPDSIRKALASYPVHGDIRFEDWGNVYCLDGDVKGAQTALGERVANAFDEGYMPIVLGGGHEVAYGSYLGLFSHLYGVHGKPRYNHQEETIGIINFDAHLDLRATEEHTSGSSFYHIARFNKAHGKPFHYMCLGVARHRNTRILLNRAKEWKVPFMYDKEVHISNMGQVLERVDHFLSQIDHLYVTIDLDVFASYITPGVSAPSVRGINAVTFERVFQHIMDSQKLRMIDLAECNPVYDVNNRTAEFAAFIIFNLMF